MLGPLATWHSPHTAVQQTPAGIHTRSRRVLCGICRCCGTAGYHTCSSGFHSECPRSQGDTGSDNPLALPIDKKKRKLVRHWADFIWFYLWNQIVYWMLKNMQIPCMLLHSGIDRGSYLNLKNNIWTLEYVRCCCVFFKRGLVHSLCKVWKRNY